MFSILPLNKITSEDRHLVGAKALSLSSLLHAGLPVPSSFVVTTQFWQNFQNIQNLSEKIQQELTMLDPHDPVSLRSVSERIQHLIKSTVFSHALTSRLFNAYESLMPHHKQPFVALRVSQMTHTFLEDPHPLFLNTKGEASVLELIKEIWTQLYTPTALQQATDPTKQEVAIIVQAMIPAESSGLFHTYSDGGKTKDQLQIEAIWGLGEYLAQHQVKPDRYEVNIQSFQITKKNITPQYTYLTHHDHTTKEQKVTSHLQHQPKLTDHQILALAKFYKQIQHIHTFPQTVEWVFDGNQFYFVQTQSLLPATQESSERNLFIPDPDQTFTHTPLRLPVIVNGQKGSPGIVSGFVKHLYHTDDLSQLSSHDIAVVKQFTPEFYPAIKVCQGLISEKDSMISNAVLLPREIGTPSIVSVKNVRNTLKDGQLVTIDGFLGLVYQGRPNLRSQEIPYSRQQIQPHQDLHLISVREAKEKLVIKTVTKIYTSLPAAQNSEFLKAATFDGVIQIKGELIIAEAGLHPHEQATAKISQQFIKKPHAKLDFVLNQVPHKDVFYHISDIQSQMARQLTSGELHEPQEVNPLLGYRGVYRHLFHRHMLELELKTIKSLREKHRHLHLVIPLVRHSKELTQMLHIIGSLNFGPKNQLKIFQNLQTPANLIHLPDYHQSGINGFIVDMAELTKLMLGVDPANLEVSQLYQPTDPSIIWLVSHAAKYCKRHEIPFIVCSDTVGIYPQLAQVLISSGVNGFAVPPDLVHAARRFASLAENKLLKK